jgi:MFS family permease
VYTDRTVGILLLSKGVQVFATSVLVTFSGLAGSQLASINSLSTLPMTIMLISMAGTTAAASSLFSHMGRRAGFAFGAFVGALGGAICTWGIVQESFLALCAGCALLGAYQGSAQYYRFAAADAVRPEDKGHAVSAVMAGGILGAVVGPFVSMWAQVWLAPNIFAGPFFALALVLAVNAVAICCIREGSPSCEPSLDMEQSQVSLLLFDAAFWRAICLGAGAYAVMTYVMTAAPLAMLACGHVPGTATAGIQWHLIAMFAPAFATGYLQRRFGLTVLLYAGSLGFVGSVLFFLAGTSTLNFIGGLILLGIAWNFVYFSGTMLLVTTISKQNQAKAQAANEFAVVSSGVVASGLAGVVFSEAGWTILLASALCVIGALTVMVTAAVMSRARTTQSEAASLSR